MRRAYVPVVIVAVGLALGAIMVAGTATADDEIVVEVTVENQDGETVSGVDVTVDWEDDAETATTLPDGTQTFVVEEGANLTISVDHMDYVRNFPLERENVTLDEGQSRYSVTVPVWEAAYPTIVVEEDGDPIEDLRVRFLDREENSFVRGSQQGPGEYEVQSLPNSRTASLMTNADGEVELNRIASKENYRVDTFKAGYLVEEIDLDVDGFMTETIEVESARVDVDFFVEDDHFDPPQPVADAEISIPEQGITLTTFSDGGQDQRLPVNTDYTIEVSKNGYDGVTEELQLGESSTEFSVSIQRTPELNVDALNTQVIVGQTTRVTVTNAYDEPVAGATITVDGEEVGETDQTGSFDVTLESEGEQTVGASHGGLSEEVTIEAFDPGADDIPEDIQDEVDDVDEDDDDDDDADDDGAGFGALVAIGALIATLGLLHRRR